MVPFLGDFSYNRSERKMIERGGRALKKYEGVKGGQQ
jgi:hypothetical protein